MVRIEAEKIGKKRRSKGKTKGIKTKKERVSGSLRNLNTKDLEGKTKEMETLTVNINSD